MATHVFFLLRSSFRDCKRNWKVRNQQREIKKRQRKILIEEKELEKNLHIEESKELFAKKRQKTLSKVKEIVKELSNIDEESIEASSRYVTPRSVRNKADKEVSVKPSAPLNVHTEDNRNNITEEVDNELGHHSLQVIDEAEMQELAEGIGNFVDRMDSRNQFKPDETIERMTKEVENASVFEPDDTLERMSKEVENVILGK